MPQSLYAHGRAADLHLAIELDIRVSLLLAIASTVMTSLSSLLNRFLEVAVYTYSFLDLISALQYQTHFDLLTITGISNSTSQSCFSSQSKQLLIKDYFQQVATDFAMEFVLSMSS